MPGWSVISRNVGVGSVTHSDIVDHLRYTRMPYGVWVLSPVEGGDKESNDLVFFNRKYEPVYVYLHYPYDTQIRELVRGDRSILEGRKIYETIWFYHDGHDFDEKLRLSAEAWKHIFNETTLPNGVTRRLGS